MPTYEGLPAPSSAYLKLVMDADLLVLSTAARLRQHWTAHAASKQLADTQVKVLLALVPGESIPMRTLAARLDYDASNLTSLIDRLESRCLVKRCASAEDRRVKSLALSPAGEQLRAKFWSDLVEDPGPLQLLSQPEVEGLINLLTKLTLEAERPERPMLEPTHD